MPGTTSYTVQQIRDVLSYTDPKRPKPNYDEIAREMQQKYGPNRKGTWKAGSIKYLIDNYSSREEYVPSNSQSLFSMLIIDSYQFFPWQRAYQRSQNSNAQHGSAPETTYGQSAQRTSSNLGQQMHPSWFSHGQFQKGHSHPKQLNGSRPTQNTDQEFAPRLAAVAKHLGNGFTHDGMSSSLFYQEGDIVGYRRAPPQSYISYPGHAEQRQMLQGQHSAQINNHQFIGHRSQINENCIDGPLSLQNMLSHQDSYGQDWGQSGPSTTHRQLPNVHTSQLMHQTTFLQRADTTPEILSASIHPHRHIPKTPQSQIRISQENQSPQLYVSPDRLNYVKELQYTPTSQHENQDFYYSSYDSGGFRDGFGINQSRASPHSGHVNNRRNKDISLHGSAVQVAGTSHHHLIAQAEQQPVAGLMNSPNRPQEEFNVRTRKVKLNIDEALKSAHAAMSQGVAIDRETCNFVSCILLTFSNLDVNDIPDVSEDTLRKFRSIADYQRAYIWTAQHLNGPERNKFVKDQSLQATETSSLNGHQNHRQDMSHDFVGCYQTRPSRVMGLQPEFTQDHFPTKSYDFNNFDDAGFEHSYPNIHTGMENYVAGTSMDFPIPQSMVDTIDTNQFIDSPYPHDDFSAFLDIPDDQINQETDVSSPKAEVASMKRKTEEGLTDERAAKRQSHVVRTETIHPEEILATHNELSHRKIIDKSVTSTGVELVGLMAAPEHATEECSDVASSSSISAQVQDSLKPVAPPATTTEASTPEAPGVVTDSAPSSSSVTPGSQPGSGPASLNSVPSRHKIEYFLATLETETGHIETSDQPRSTENIEIDGSSTENIFDWSEFNSVSVVAPSSLRN